MKKLSVLSLGLCIVLALASCKSKESMYKKAYEKAQAQEVQQPATTEPVVTPLETTTPSESTNTEVDNASVRQENVSLVAGSGLQNFSVVVGSFSLKANAEGLYNTLKNSGYDAQIVFNSERNMYRVVASTFVDKAGAVKSRNELRASKYPDAWLLFKK
uniref:SPOR domain-containing protein n=1 Tax=Segatella hominis TaxID=2518605 RepID=UPI0040294862